MFEFITRRKPPQRIEESKIALGDCIRLLTNKIIRADEVSSAFPFKSIYSKYQINFNKFTYSVGFERSRMANQHYFDVKRISSDSIRGRRVSIDDDELMDLLCHRFEEVEKALLDIKSMCTDHKNIIAQSELKKKKTLECIYNKIKSIK